MLQTWPAGHAVPQLPQLAPSEPVSTQAPEQATSGLWQTHEPELHCCPTWHETPQPPQFVGLCNGLTHPSGQAMSPVGQEHEPLTQAVPGGHTLPQAPQLLGSLAANTQVAAHGICPAAQPLAPPPSPIPPDAAPPEGLPPSPLPSPFSGLPHPPTAQARPSAGRESIQTRAGWWKIGIVTPWGRHSCLRLVQARPCSEAGRRVARNASLAG